MELRKKVIEKIEERGGIAEFIAECDHFMSRLHKQSEILIVEGMIVYYRTLFRVPTSVEADVIKYDTTMSEMRVLFNKHKDCSNFAKFYTEIIDLKYEHTHRVKKLRT